MAKSLPKARSMRPTGKYGRKVILARKGKGAPYRRAFQKASKGAFECAFQSIVEETMKLFKVGAMGGVTYFHTKPAAKNYRNSNKGRAGYLCVMRGPDHNKGESFNVSRPVPEQVKGYRS